MKNFFVKLYLFIISCIVSLSVTTKFNIIIMSFINMLIFIYNVFFNPTPIVLNKFYLIFALISLVLVLQAILKLIFAYLVHNKKIKKSIFKPRFLNKYIDYIERFIYNDTLKYYFEFYYVMLYCYLFMLIYATSCYYFKLY